MEKEAKGFAKILLIVTLLFFISMWKSCTELRYIVASDVTEGSITDVYDDKGRRGRETGKKNVNWHFPVNGKSFYGGMVVDPETALTVKNTGSITVQYLTGNPMINRRKGDNSYFWVIAFLGCLGAVGYFGYLTYLDAQKDLVLAKKGTETKTKMKY